MDKHVIETLLRFKTDISDIGTAVKDVQKHFDGLKPTANFEKNFLNVLSKLQNEISSFEAKSARGVSSMADASALEKSGKNIIELYEQIKNQIKTMGKMSDSELKKLFPDIVSENVKKSYEALAKYQSEQKKLNTELDKELQLQEKKKKILDDVQEKQKNLSGKKKVTTVEYDQTRQQRSDVNKAYQAAVKELNAAQSEIDEALSKGAKMRNDNTGLRDYGGKYTELNDKFAAATKAAKELGDELKRLDERLENEISEVEYDEQFKGLEKEAEVAQKAYDDVTTKVKGLEEKSSQAFKSLVQDIQSLTGIDLPNIEEGAEGIKQINEALENTSAGNLQQVKAIIGNLDEDIIAAIPALAQLRDRLDDVGHEAKELTETQKQLENFKNNILQFFSIGNAVNLFKRAVSSAIQTVKELDAVMTEIAVVSDFDIGDMWDKLPDFTDQANKLGVAVKDMYSATTLYIQQGLNMNDSLALSNQTMKMARIAGLNAADATNAMTAALRGFNMELNETSAERISDVYSKLAAITASDVKEISKAMTKTASIASNANMEFETTAAFLSQIIETTRESAETAGTAMKTVIARFQELKKDPSEIGEVDGEIVDANKIETALRSIGVSLRDTQGQFRDLDDVFLEIAKKWDSLDTNTQRYIATMAAGSRQQSRFIAMMSNYDRTMELVSAANNSAGASQEQFEKTLESLDAKLAKLKNAWDEFTTGIANNELIKFGVDALTDLLELVNKLSSGTGDFGEALIKLGLGFGAIKGGKALLTNLFAQISGNPAAKSGMDIATDFLSGFKTKITDTKSIRQAERGINKLFAGFKKIDTKEIEKVVSMPINEAFKNIGANGVNLEQIQKNLREALEKNKTNFAGKDSQYEFLKQNIDEGSLESLKKAYSEIGVEVEGIEVKTTEMSQKNVADWQAIGAATAAAGMALTAFGNKLEQSGDEKIQNLGKVITGLGTALTVFGTVMSVVVPLHAQLMAKGVSTAIFSIPIIGWIAAIVSAVIGLGVAIAKFHESDAERAERHKKELDAAKSAAEEAQAAYEELLSSFDKYNDTQNALEDLVEGTEEWQKALREANEQVLEILKTYPKLAQYIEYGEHGQLSISKEGQQVILDEGRRAAANAQRGYYAAEINAISRDKYKATPTIETQWAIDNLKPEDFKVKSTYTTEQFIQDLTDGTFASKEGREELKGILELNGHALTDAERWIKQLKSGNEQKIEKATDEITKLNLQGYSDKIFEALDYYGLKSVSDLEEYYAKAMSEAQELEKLQKQYENSVKGFFFSSLNTDISEELQKSGHSNDFVELFAEAYSIEDFEEGVATALTAYSDIDSRDDLVNMYLERTGLEKLPEDLAGATADQLKEALAGMDYMEQVSNTMNDFYSKVQKKGKERAKKLMKILQSEGGGLSYDEAMKMMPKLDAYNKYGNSKDIDEYLLQTTGFDLQGLADAVGVDIKEMARILTENVDIAAKTIWQAKSKLARNNISTEWAEKFALSSSSLNSLADNIYQVFLRSGESGAKGITELLNNAAGSLNEEEFQLFTNALNSIDWSNTESIETLSDTLESMGFEAGIGGLSLEELEEHIKDLAKATSGLTFEDLKERLKGLENIGKEIESGNADYIFNKQEYEDLLASDFSESDFVQTGIEEWTYIAGPIETILKHIDGNTTNMLKNMLSETKEKIERGNKIASVGKFSVSYITERTPNKDEFAVTTADGQVETVKVARTETYSNILDYILPLFEKDFKANGPQYNEENLRHAARTIGADRGGEINIGEMGKEDLINLIKDYTNTYYGNTAEGLVLKANQESYNEQRKSLEDLTQTLKNPYAFLSTSEDEREATIAKARELGVSDAVIDEFVKATKNGNLTKEQYNKVAQPLLDEITSKLSELNLSKTASTITEILDKYPTIEDIDADAYRDIAYTLGIKIEDLTEEQIKAIDKALRGDFESFEKLVTKLGTDIGVVFENGKITNVRQAENKDAELVEMLEDGLVEMRSIEVKKNEEYLTTVMSDDGTQVIGFEVAKAAADGIVQGLAMTSKETFKAGTGNYSGEAASIFDEEKERKPFDKYFDDMQKINAEARKRNQLEREYNRLLEDENTTVEDLKTASQNQINSLKNEKKLVEDLIALKQKDLPGFGEVEGTNSIVTLNSDLTLTIKDDVLNALRKSSPEEFDRIVDYINELEEMVKGIQELEDRAADIEDDVQDISNRGRDSYLGLEERLADSLINIRQEELDAMREINDSINDAATDLMDAVQSNIDKMRQDRENEKTENEIAEKERRLAYLRQDTSGANAAEIKSLEKEIAQQKEGYGDSLIDQALSDMQKQNEEAAKQREEQLQKQQEAHDLMVENGGYAKKAMGILAETLEKGTAFDKTSEFYKTLYGGEKGSVLTDAAYEKWMEDLIYSVNSASAYNNSSLPKTEVPIGYNAVTEKDDIMAKMRLAYEKAGRVTKDILIMNEIRNRKIDIPGDAYDESVKILTWYELLKQLNGPYASGGLADFTGPAWLDGTKSHPELILNARDTENFILLKDALSKAVNGGLSGSSDNGGDNYFDITIEVEEIGNDYDVDQMAARIKQQIYEDSAYRNVNTINFLR